MQHSFICTLCHKYEMIFTDSELKQLTGYELPATEDHYNYLFDILYEHFKRCSTLARISYALLPAGIGVRILLPQLRRND